MLIEPVAFTLAGRYRIFSNARFLSHQETMRVFTRALVRSGLKLIYSQGFNPRPKFSLAVPRSVALASDDELFVVKIALQNNSSQKLKEMLAAQLPVGFELKSIELKQGNVKYVPHTVEYEIINDGAVSQELINEVNNKIKNGWPILLQRTTDAKGTKKTVNVAEFLNGFAVNGQKIIASCKISPAGTVRPNEILELLSISAEKISSSIVRKNITCNVS